MRTTARLVPLLVPLALAACAVGPDYKRPETTVPPAWKEAPPEGNPAAAPEAWKPAEPRDAGERGDWWRIFDDPLLDSLEAQVAVSNQNIAQAEAQFRGARAAVRGARADFIPTVTATASFTRSQTGTDAPVNRYSLPVDLTYEIDVWGRVRRNVESSVAAAQASAADLENVRLTMHAELALDYFALRGLDTEKDLLDTNVVAYEKALQVTMNRYREGIVSGVDVAQAQTILEATRANATDTALARARLEHAIATLVGKPPADFSISPAIGLTLPPAIPAGVPSELLERRPDIASSERRVAAANAQIGVAIAAYFPRIVLGASAGYEGPTLADWFTLPSRFWSIGPAIVATILDGGRRRAVTEQARAATDAAAAVYRLDVLSAFQDVEDNLAALRLLEQEAAQQAAALAAAERSLTIARNRYLAGITTYLEVVTAQVAALNNASAAVLIQVRRLTAAVNLIKALGGGWTTSELPYGGSPAAAGTADSAPGSLAPVRQPD